MHNAFVLHFSHTIFDYCAEIETGAMTTRRKKTKPFVLALMPFSGAFESVYKEGIKKACMAGGRNALRAHRRATF